MAHNLEVFADGTAAFFTNREVAWHRLGTVTDGALTADEALRIAQLDWTVSKSSQNVQVPVLTANGITVLDVADRYATYRDHPKLGMQALGIVGKQYQVVQNSEAFEFLNHVADESGAVFETAGSMNGGRQVFMSMKMPEGVVLADGQDTVDMYIMATNSHDGSKAFTAAVTPIRPVCANTVRLALKSARSSWYIRHTQNVQGRIQQAREALGLAFSYREAFQAEVDSLAVQAFTDAEFDAFIESLVVDKRNKTDRQRNNEQQVMAEMRGLWNAPTQDGIRYTKWGAFNTVVEWIDWAKPVKAKGGDEGIVRAERIMSGALDGFKDRAYSLLV
jgi:phage/plasmid-like protein (TIGR03299 family)